MAALYSLLKESRNYLWTALLIFLFGSVVGFLYAEAFEQLIAPLLGELEKIAEKLVANPHPLYMMWLIFQNNVTAAFTMMVTGFFLFFVPIFSLFMNGLAVGYVLAISALDGAISPLSMLLFGILPHGLLELPAVFVAGGIGMFLGLRLVRWLFGSGQFFAHLLGQMRTDVGTFWREETLPVLIQRGKGVLLVALLLIALLFLAALIESFVTPVLIQLFVY